MKKSWKSIQPFYFFLLNFDINFPALNIISLLLFTAYVLPSALPPTVKEERIAVNTILYIVKSLFTKILIISTVSKLPLIIPHISPTMSLQTLETLVLFFARLIASLLPFIF